MNTTGVATSRFMIRAAITRPMCHRIQGSNPLDLGAENKGSWPVGLRSSPTGCVCDRVEQSKRGRKVGHIPHTAFIETKKNLVEFGFSLEVSAWTCNKWPGRLEEGGTGCMRSSSSLAPAPRIHKHKIGKINNNYNNST